MLSPAEAVAAFKLLGCSEDPKHSRKNYVWLELKDASGHQIAIFNVPTSKNPIRRGTLEHGLLQPNGIRDEAHLNQLLEERDPRAAFLLVVPRQGPRYTPRGQ